MQKLAVATVVVILVLAGYWWWQPSEPSHGSSARQESDSATEKAPDLPTPDDAKPAETVPQANLPPVREVPMDDGTEVSSPEQAQQVVDEQDLNLGPDSELQVSGSTSDDYGYSYYQLEQRYKGIPVFGSQALLEVSEGQAQLLNGVWFEQIDLNTEPTHSAEEALRLALDHRGVPAERTISVLGTPALLVYVTEQGATLSWRVIASLSNPEAEPQRYLVDAHNPTIYLQEPVLQR
ncbi:hypothetical protein [Marinobacter zhejiangensis]|uniref:Fungalysin/Thermolysin Propeptide Motif n=1 Tax=Marinobacter zhejiangensis TaxID=488535 RepID=A0A1I4SG10_9GAMM|nr:hypothetical protein [Marinobacter zhejiangensis]SFM63251.1 Fungalysin/Thermolysin Propeptide Motif [Marinobacter zhejiangensis]